MGGCFFFQAEDGIRDLVRSRGLGDVYKRQTLGGTSSAVVIPMVRQISMQEISRTYLVLESALSDVLCIVLSLIHI